MTTIPGLPYLEERDDIDSLNKAMTEMSQQSWMSIEKQTKKQKKPNISSPTRALVKKRRKMIENKTPPETTYNMCGDISDHKKGSEGRYPEV